METSTTPAPRKSLAWQKLEHEARCSSGITDLEFKVWDSEKFVFDQAFAVTGLYRAELIRLMIHGVFNLETLEAQIVELAHQKEQAERCSLDAIDAIETDIKQFAAAQRKILRDVEDRVTAGFRRPPLRG